MYTITIKDLNRVFLAEVAADEHLSLRDYLRSRIDAVGLPMADSTLPRSLRDVDGCELCTRSLSGDETTSLAYRLRVRSRGAARVIGDILIARYEERVFGNRLSSEYVQVGDGVFTPSAVRVPLVPSPLPPLRTPLASPRLQPHSRFHSRRVSGCTSRALRCRRWRSWPHHLRSANPRR